MADDEPEEKRLRIYFWRRAVELLEQAQKETDPIKRLDTEARCARYWAIVRGAR